MNPAEGQSSPEALLDQGEDLEQVLAQVFPDPTIRALVASTLGKSGIRKTGMKPQELLKMAQQILSDRKEGDDGVDTAGSILELLKRRLGVGNDILEQEVNVVHPLAGADAADPQSLIRAVTELAKTDGAKDVLNRLLPGRTIRKAEAQVGRNDKCPCGSGRKFKACCMKK